MGNYLQGISNTGDNERRRRLTNVSNNAEQYTNTDSDDIQWPEIQKSKGNKSKMDAPIANNVFLRFYSSSVSPVH